MPAQKKQHYVPQFYMKGFANEKGGISILNLTDYSVRNEVPYKSQCSIDYFYGKDGEWEAILSKKESEWASVLRKLNDEETITSADMKTIREFIIYQRQRTEAEDIKIKEQKTQIAKETVRMKLLHEKTPFIDSEIEDSCRKYAAENTIPAESLANAERLEHWIEDLAMIVIQYNTENEFVFSDTPVVFINPFHHAAIGYGCMGLIIVLPISPHKVLILFDDGVYQTKSSGFYQYSNDDNEIYHFNVLQLISASKRVMGNSALSLELFDDLAKAARNDNRDHEIAPVFGNEDNKLMWISMRKCTYNHDWGFIRIKNNAKRIPRICRDIVMREWSTKQEERLDIKVRIIPQIMEKCPAGMTEKELIGGLQRMSTFAKEYWRNKKPN